jgi:hypothetical protein
LEINVLDLVLRLVELHIAITPEERMAVALWILHTYVFQHFTITPRLAILSPVRGCGKTTLLALIEQLVGEPFRVDDVTAAAIYYQIDRRPYTTLLIDEGDNLGLLNNVCCAPFNSGHRKGGAAGRYVGGWSQKFSTFAPLAIAAIGYTLPLPLMHRAAAVISMQRASGAAQITELDEDNPAFPASCNEIRKWAAMCSPARNPKMPPSLRNRAADNWRVLLAIADELGHGEDARAAAVTLCAHRVDEDPGVLVLIHIRMVFDARGVDRISSAVLIGGLLEIEDAHWGDWRGPLDDRPSRKLSQDELARLVRPFGIRPKSVWPVRRRPGDKSAKGYYRWRFEDAWASYCPPAGTTARPAKVLGLSRRNDGPQRSP